MPTKPTRREVLIAAATTAAVLPAPLLPAPALALDDEEAE